MYLMDLIVRSAEGALVSLSVEYRSKLSAAQKICERSSNLRSLIDPSFFGRFLSISFFKMVFRKSFEPFVFFSSSIPCSIKHVSIYKQVFISIFVSSQIFNKRQIRVANFVSEFRKGLQSPELAARLEKYCVGSFRMQKLSSF